jgi:hypothetical protein
MNRILKIVATCLLLLSAVNVSAQDKKDMFNPVNASVTSQTIAPDARAAGMGDVGVATDPDVVSQYWNPAKYPFTISRAGVALNYTPWLRQLVNDMDLAYLAGYYRIGDYSAISGSLRYFSLGEVMTSSDLSSSNDMTINPYEMSLDVAYSLMLSEKFSIAAGVRWIYSDLTYDYTEDTSPGSAFAADLSAYYQDYIMLGDRECQLGLGLNISNIGSKITFGGDDNSEFYPHQHATGCLAHGAGRRVQPLYHCRRCQQTARAHLSQAERWGVDGGLPTACAERLLRRVEHQRYLQELRRRPQWF